MPGLISRRKFILGAMGRLFEAAVPGFCENMSQRQQALENIVSEIGAKYVGRAIYDPHRSKYKSYLGREIRNLDGILTRKAVHLLAAKDNEYSALAYYEKRAKIEQLIPGNEQLIRRRLNIILNNADAIIGATVPKTYAGGREKSDIYVFEDVFFELALNIYSPSGNANIDRIAVLPCSRDLLKYHMTGFASEAKYNATAYGEMRFMEELDYHPVVVQFSKRVKSCIEQYRHFEALGLQLEAAALSILQLQHMKLRFMTPKGTLLARNARQQLINGMPEVTEFSEGRRMLANLHQDILQYELSLT